MTSDGNSKTLVLITGANKSLGYLMAQQLGTTGKFHVLIGARDTAKGQEAIESLAADSKIPNSASSFDVVAIDISSDESIQKAADHIKSKYGKLDILINNAGVNEMAFKEESSRAKWQKTFDTNTFGTAVVTETLTPLIKASKNPDRRIVFVSSGLGSCAEALKQDSAVSGFKYSGFMTYRASKSAVNMLAIMTSIVLGKDGITVCSTDPGYCATDFNGNTGYRPAAEGAKTILRGVFDPKETVHGKYISDEGEGGYWEW